MRTKNNHRTKAEAGTAKIPVNFIVIFLFCLLLLVGCGAPTEERRKVAEHWCDSFGGTVMITDGGIGGLRSRCKNGLLIIMDDDSLL